MTGGIGFTKLGQALQRRNRSLLNHTDKVKSKKDSLKYRSPYGRLKFKKTTKKDLEAFKAKLLHEKKRNTIKTAIMIFITVIVVVYFAWWIFWQ